MENIDSKSLFKNHRITGKKIGRILGATIVGILIAALFALIFGYLVEILWNWLMPVIFGISKISYWQAFGIVILAKFLFGGFGSHHDPHRNDDFHRKMDTKWHRFFEKSDDSEEETVKVDKKWKCYEKFWEDEGKSAFESYIRKIESTKDKKE